MKIHFFPLMPALICFFATSVFATPEERTYVGSTPAHGAVRDFLQISLTDSIDFIRWKLVIGTSRYELQCRYGLAKAGTPGFVNEITVAFEGELSKKEDRYCLQHKDKRLSLLEVNADLLHLLDQNNDMLVGNGGYSYALNSTVPVKTDQFNMQQSIQSTTKSPLVFEGRTPCQELSRLLGLNKSDACNKMKWYIIFYTDSVTRKPSSYLKGGIGYRKETMERGKWQILSGKNGRIIYQVNPDGRLLVGNENFSYTLNRRKEEYPPIRR